MSNTPEIPGNVVLPPETTTPFELRACRKTKSGLEAITLRQEATRARAKRILQEELSSVLAQLRARGWICDNEDVEKIHFEIADMLRGFTRVRPISNHPIRGKEQPKEPTIWFENITAKTLKSLNRYEVIAIGRKQYQINSPDGTNSVDLEAAGGFGTCTCEDFHIRRSPYREKAKKFHDGKLILLHQDCTHLKHIKFLLGIPFGNISEIAPQNLEDPGSSPKNP